MKKIAFIIITLFSIVTILVCNNYFKLNEELSESKTNIAIYIKNQGGEYEVQKSNSIPDANYKLNTKKSYCVNGSSIQLDENNKIDISLIGTDDCYLYYDFHAFNEVILINNGAETGEATSYESAVNYIENKTTPNFASGSTTDEGMYATLDDFGTSYYFRGAVNDNWVEFAGFYWRIIRIDGQGNIRLIYSGSVDNPGTVSSDGVIMTGSQTEITRSNYYNSYNDPTYVGYQRVAGDLNGYGDNAVDSNIKRILDNWYVENIENPGYESYIADAVYCNDRTLYSDMAGGEGNKLNWPISGNNNYYGSFTRLMTNKPSLVCPDKSDKFTVRNDIGNGALDYSIALITMDEFAFAGGDMSTRNRHYYLYTEVEYWTLSPYYYVSSGNAYVGEVSGFGFVYGNYVDYSYGVRAVVSLSSEILYAGGSGTWNDPYVVE